MLQKNDIIEIGQTHAHATPGRDSYVGIHVDGDFSTIETAVVTHVTENNQITYVPAFGYPNSVRCGFGVTTYGDYGKYATTMIRKIGTVRSFQHQRRPNLKGNPAYDLMM